MASRKRSQEEKNLRTLRELASLSANKQCFDCHQRGPTYVNMLIGSFVCTSCSGILRGLNPPHRVKSITMTVFTPEEVEFIRSRGNDYCRQVWLGLYDPRSLLEPESRDEQKIKEFMMQKYEKKRWYISPENVSFRSQQPTPPVPSNNTSTQPPQQFPQPDTKPLSTLLGKEPVPLVLQSPPQGPAWSQANSNFNQNTMNNNYNNNNPNQVVPAPLSVSKRVDLLGDLGVDPFSPAPPSAHPHVQHSNVQSVPVQPAQLPSAPVSNTSANGNFANFESAFSDSMSSGSSGFTPDTPGNTSFVAVFPNTVVPAPPPIINKVESAKVEASAAPAFDRYAALADLDSLFHTQQDSTSTSSGSALNGPSPPPLPAPAPQPATSATPWGIGTVSNSTPANTLTSAPTGQPYSAPNPFLTATPPVDSWSNIPPQSHPNGAQKPQQSLVFNPFQQQQPPQQLGFVSGPYNAVPAFNNVDSYIALGSQPGFATPYFQSVGGPVSDLGPQYVMQNGANVGATFVPNTWTAQDQQQTWMQNPTGKFGFPAFQPQANPFLTGNSAPKLNPGNPFL